MNKEGVGNCEFHAVQDQPPPKGFDGVLVEGLLRPFRLDAFAGVEAEAGRDRRSEAGHGNQRAGGDRCEAGEDHVVRSLRLLYGQHDDVIACNCDLDLLMRS